MSEVSSLYDGKVTLALDGKHRYWRDNVRIPSVTQCIGIIDKPALRYWFLNVAMDYIKRGLEPGVAYDEIQLGNLFKGAKTAHRGIANDAADIGKVVHNWIEEFAKSRIRGKKGKPKFPINPMARAAVDAFLEWDTENHVEYLFAERKMFSEEMQAAGTVDIVGKVNGEFAIIDIKTSKAVYPEYHLQTAAYAYMSEEEGLADVTDCDIQRLIIHVPKDGSGFTVHEPKNSYTVDIEAFQACRNVYRWKEGY